MKTVGVADYTQITQCKHSKGGVDIMMSTFKHFQKYNKILSNVNKIECTHLQCVNNHYAKFEYNGMKTVGVTNYTNQTPPKHSGWKNVKAQHPLKIEKTFIKCAQNRKCTSSMCEQSLHKVLNTKFKPPKMRNIHVMCTT